MLYNFDYLLKINMIIPIDAKIKDVLVHYITRVNIGPNSIGNSFYFLYQEKTINKNKKKTIWKMNILGSSIFVIDKQGIMGN